MFIDNLLSFDELLDNTDISKASIVTERLNKINSVYLKELVKSSDIVEFFGKKSLMKRVIKP